MTALPLNLARRADAPAFESLRPGESLPSENPEVAAVWDLVSSYTLIQCYARQLPMEQSNCPWIILQAVHRSQALLAWEGRL